MGLTASSSGKNVYKTVENTCVKEKNEVFVVMAGNPNVGKSTLFNAITGMKQHTGNWSGKTVSSSFGKHFKDGTNYIFADVPGCYSLKPNSAEEACAADYICMQKADCVVVVCDTCSLERNLDLVLQICEASANVVLALNFTDEAVKKDIHIDADKLSQVLSVPVVKVNARKKKGIGWLLEECANRRGTDSFKVRYKRCIEYAVNIVEKTITDSFYGLNKRYVAIRVLEDDKTIWKFLEKHTSAYNLMKIRNARHVAMNYLVREGISRENLSDSIAVSVANCASSVYKKSLLSSGTIPQMPKADKIITGRYSGFVIMMLLLVLIFYITLKFANYPSDFIGKLLFSAEKYLMRLCLGIRLPRNISNMLVYGGYRVLSWVVAVMLPPMAIFFPLFTILEDVGYLPRIAYNLDRCFKKCKTCGKQALTTCMGFGCNAAGVTGARIIDSPREKLIAILTNSFIPCNGRFPAILTLISLWLCGSSGYTTLYSSLWLTFFIIASVGLSLAASWFLSHTVLKGVPSSFTIELPPYRMPNWGDVVVRSVLDRTIFVLGRACAVAFPSGIILYIMCNLKIADASLISYISEFFAPIGRCMGMDGVLITAFLFAIPANEIVLPTALLLYTSSSVLSPDLNLMAVKDILWANGWSITTCICTVVFFLMHWPCSTTLITVKKETGSLKWTLASFLLPTAFGVAICMAVNLISKLLFT